jgi:GNAT superfamily N-acetyltransferase
MQIREANDSDIPGIISVLKASLGESKLPKTERVWRYKHIDNPFGKSLVLIAIEDEIIIGVRAFMRWKWQYKGKVYSTFRAVDTATHPHHQGKGVFKKLTLKAIELGVINGDDFIFNTPNNQSLPGYLKMGWEELGKLKINICPINVLYWKRNKDNFYYKAIYKSTENQLKNLIKIYNAKMIDEGKLFTPKSLNYLNWRYAENILQKYEIYCDNNIYLAGYIKNHKYFRELRIVEHIYDSSDSYERMMLITKSWSKQFGAQVKSFAGYTHKDKFTVSGNYGPIFTIRNVSMDSENYKCISEFENWNYCLGDLELF